MQEADSLLFRINTKILLLILVLVTVTSVSISVLNLFILRSIYEENFTSHMLLSNTMMASMINADEVDYYVDLMRGQDADFKKRQAAFYRDREDLFALMERNGPKEEQQVLLDRMAAFHAEMSAFKSGRYWDVVNSLRRLKEISRSTYVYVFADTGVMADDGTKLYTYIFDAEDNAGYTAPDDDGLGTVIEGEPAVAEVQRTKKPMEKGLYYKGIYGELYYAYAPVLNGNGSVIAILGTDTGVDEMQGAVRRSMLLFNLVFFSFGILVILVLYIFVARYVVKPLEALTVTAQKLTDGDVYACVPDFALQQNSELGTLARAVKNMSGVYQSMIQSTGELFEAAKTGKLDVRNDAADYKGDIKKLVLQINDTLDVMTSYLNGVSESIFIMNKNFDVHFKNERYIKYFGTMTVFEFFAHYFSDGTNEENSKKNNDDPELIKKHFAESLDGEAREKIVWINGFCFSISIKEIGLRDSSENIIMVISIDITDLMREKENAQSAAKAKSDFLSRMSHEMRTPMNAIIGMARIAESTDDVLKLKHCVDTIGTSSNLLLGIINDVLDMSKIEAGKFELEHLPMNIEKMLIKLCNILVGSMEKKGQKFDVILGKDLCLNYMGDELRLSQVIANLLSNAVKFTQEHGKIILVTEEVSRQNGTSILRFSVLDNGIGMTKEQINRLFTSFEQADGSITRRFGGTGLGLVISKNIVEKMGGTIRVESEAGAGSSFIFDVRLERASLREALSPASFRPSGIRLLIAARDDELKKRFLAITDNLGIRADAAADGEEAIAAVNKALESDQAYHVVFINQDMLGEHGFDIVKRFDEKIDRRGIVIISSFMEWSNTEKYAVEAGISRYITSPLFPSAILDVINECRGEALKARNGSADVQADAAADSSADVPDFSGLRILLAEDVEINREIFLALLSETRIEIDCAENGRIAVEKFRENPGKYDLIIMDIQMPEMDGYEATKTIRALDAPNAGTVPIIALTANAFKEDIERCIACGMNDHLSKPIDDKMVIEKIKRYAQTG